MKALYSIGFAALVILSLAACEKDKPLEDTPYIEIASITPGNAQAYVDTVVITVFYRDGNGDLGENNPDVYNLFVTDNRNNVTYKYRVQQLAPTDANVAIQGNLKVELVGPPIINGGASESVSYSVYVTDRAGNQSNTATTEGITISE
jgi:hypothetical protein